MYGNANAQGAVQRRAEDGRGSIALFPIMAAVFVAFLVIGMAMPVLPLHVHEGLALSTFIVGLVAGTQFGAAILSRVCVCVCGRADTRMRAARSAPSSSAF